MKKQFLLPVTLVMFLAFSAGTSFAQKITKVDTLPTVYIFSTSLVNKTVHKAFKRDFKGAVNPRWYLTDQNFLVKFMSNDQKNHALYNRKGSIIYHITYITGNGLPRDIFGLVNAKYTNAAVLTAFHVEQNSRNIWLVNLKVNGEIVVGRVEEEQVEEIERYHDVGV